MLGSSIFGIRVIRKKRKYSLDLKIICDKTLWFQFIYGIDYLLGKVWLSSYLTFYSKFFIAITFVCCTFMNTKDYITI